MAGNIILTGNSSATGQLTVTSGSLQIGDDGTTGSYDGNIVLTPEFRARYIANIGDVSTDYNVWMPGSPVSALMATRATDRHTGDLGLGLGFTRGWTTFRGDYGYMFSKHHQNQFASLTASWQF